MRLRDFCLCASLLSLGACTTPDMSSWTPEQVANYQAREAQAYQQIITRGQQSQAQMAQQTQVLQQQAAQAPASTQVAPYGQQPSTAIVYCRDLTGSLIACKQVN